MMIIWVIAFVVCFAIVAWLVESAPEFEEVETGEWRAVELKEKKKEILMTKSGIVNQSLKPEISFFRLETGFRFSSVLKSIF